MGDRAYYKMMVKRCEEDLKDAQEYLQTCIEENNTHMVEYMKTVVKGCQGSLDYYRNLLKQTYSRH